MWDKVKQGFKEWLEDARADYSEYLLQKRRRRLDRTRAKSLKRCVKEAEKKYKATNRRHYVVLDWTGRRYEVINKSDVQFRKRTGAMKKDATMYDVMRVAAYITKEGRN